MDDLTPAFIFLFTLNIIVGMVSYSKGKCTGKEIGAMEVYRGNTTLEYTIVDSVVIDSCIVFK